MLILANAFCDNQENQLIFKLWGAIQFKILMAQENDILSVPPTILEKS
jgi:hypothetical protein